MQTRQQKLFMSVAWGTLIFIAPAIILRPVRAAGSSAVSKRKTTAVSPSTTLTSLLQKKTNFLSPSTKPFMLKDANGHPRSLSDYRGQPVALLFFCGCPWCHRCATLWGQFQRGGVLNLSNQLASQAKSPTAPGNRGALPITLVVFSGDNASVREFAAQTGLDPAQTVLLPDPEMRVTTLYQADPCPRTFILDGQGRLRYTNNHADDAAQKAPEIVIASRALDALRHCTPAAAFQPQKK